MSKLYTIGTRGSELALYQAKRLKHELENAFPSVAFQLKIIKTKGDKILDTALSKIGDKGLFTKEIEDYLYSGDIDMAVHSLKDLPTELPTGLKLGGVLERGEYRDALVSEKIKSLNELKPDHVVATSSVRRKAQILRLVPGIKVIDIRGNVNTRLRKLSEACCDATFMAAAGLQRIGLEKYISEILSEEVFIPAVSQGIIGIEIRDDDVKSAELLQKINHKETFLAAMAERKFLAILEGGCQVPVACYTRIKGERFEIIGMVASVDGKSMLKDNKFGDLSEAVSIAEQLALSLLERGAAKILKS